MGSFRRVAVSLGVVAALGSGFGAAAVPSWGHADASRAHKKTTSCPNYKGGGAGVEDRFSHVKARGISCTKAHEVLGTWANSGPGGTDLGFSCKAKETKKKGTFDIRCTQGSASTSAVDKQVR